MIYSPKYYARYATLLWGAALTPVAGISSGNYPLWGEGFTNLVDQPPFAAP